MSHKVEVVGTLPTRAHDHDAGFDLYSAVDIVLEPLQRMIVPTGTFLAIPPGMVGDVRPRSGLSIKHGVTVINTPGTIDSGYRNEIGVILVNLSGDTVELAKGTRIAQLVLLELADVELVEVDELSESGDGRGLGGYGSSGS